MSGLFVSWTRANGRTADLAAALDLDPVFIHRPGRGGLLGRYVRQFRDTRRLLRTAQPERLILMLPPAPLLWAARRPRGGTRVAVDLHTGFFLDPKWSWALGAQLRRIRRLGAVAVVTNEALRLRCERAGVTAIELHDVLEGAASTPDPDPGVGLLCPLSYANDEPVLDLLAAARAVPETLWTCTGKAPDAVRAAAPDNVRFTGYISDEEYASLLGRSVGVVALTTRPHTMQRAGYEALCAGIPQLTADFPELRSFYGDAACYATERSTSIASAARALLDSRAALAQRTRELLPVRIAEQQSALGRLRSALTITQSPERGTGTAAPHITSRSHP